MTTSKGQKRAAKAPPSVPHRPTLLEWLKDPRTAVAYVEAVLDEGDSKGLMQALRNVAEAQGGIAAVAERAGLSRETLYRTLLKSGNPQLMSLTRILGATGLRLSFTHAHTGSPRSLRASRGASD
jgi:probable addiction module antidote protein